MRPKYFTALMIATAGLPIFTSPVHATPVIAQIYGIYDASGTGSLPSSVTSNPANPTIYSSSGASDTPSLFFVNPSAYSITGVQMVLTVNPLVNSGWNTLNNGTSQTVSLGTIGPNGITQLAWFGSGPLFNYDYEDNYGSNYGNNPFPGSTPGTQNPGSFAADCTLNFPGVHPEWTNFCAPIGNFEVTISGILSGSGPDNGDPVSALFGEYDVNGIYTGWEGIDPKGWSENATYDVHSGTVSGVLANICIGGVGNSCSSPLSATAVPEPSPLALFASALVGLAFVRRRKNTSSRESRGAIFTI